MPLCDERAHTAPICWCAPVRKTTERVWTHNAISVPR